MAIIEIKSLNEPGIEVFSTLTEAQLRMELEPEKGLFIAESPKVIRVALDTGWEPTSRAMRVTASRARAIYLYILVRESYWLN